jgi:ribosomal protein L40E
VGCGKNKYAAARTEDGHLCVPCWQKNPISYNPCRLCGTVEYLHSYGRCHSCVRDQHARAALSRNGAIRPDRSTMSWSPTEQRPG